MERVNSIFKHKIYQQEMKKINYYERNRIYCKHGVEHQLEVARIAYIAALEQNSSIEKELIYAAALLHDIGRGIQYETKQDHEKASVSLAESILPECGFTENEIKEILCAIRSHRDKETKKQSKLSNLICEADKRARNCFLCESSDTCYWPADKKNDRLEI